MPVGGDLLTWAGAVPAVVYVVAGGMFWYWSDGLSGDDGLTDCSLWFNVWAPACNPISYTIGETEIAAAVFLFLLL